MSFFMKKTKAAPSMVPNKGINKPMAVPIMVVVTVETAKVGFFR